MKSGGSQPCPLPAITWVLIKILMSGAQGFHFNWFWWQPGYWVFFFFFKVGHPTPEDPKEELRSRTLNSARDLFSESRKPL